MTDSVPEGRVAEAEEAAAVEPEYDPAAPAPLNVPRTPTGNAEVDDRLDRLADADHLATDGHLEVYEDVHRGLRDALTELDARPGHPGPPGPPAPAPPYGNRAPAPSYHQSRS
ncbi:hypothetical protein [Streptomyces sp. GbtcB6]|uniref:hypothetical protein n=1 Tax=Streptomyces sp. GbtcB6 TaxID=2824751 RepID=UPI001C2FB3D9|nr:hypothetical protein [Streptomyces sp. GbtcB6]